MAISVVVGGVTYEIPTTGERAFGFDLTDYLVEVANVLNNIDPGFNIPVTQANLTPGGTTTLYTVSQPQNSRHILIQYGVYRVTNLESRSETGNIIMAYDAETGAWELTNDCTGDADVFFEVNGSNQLECTANSLTGTETTSVIEFKGTIVRVS